MKTSKKYFVRVIHHDGTTSILSHRDRTEWTKKTAGKYADEFFRKHGCVCYVVEA